jgi:hypothetical protein
VRGPEFKVQYHKKLNSTDICTKEPSVALSYLAMCLTTRCKVGLGIRIENVKVNTEFNLDLIKYETHVRQTAGNIQWAAEETDAYPKNARKIN